MTTATRKVTFSLKRSSDKSLAAPPNTEELAAIALLDVQRLAPELQQRFMTADSCTAVYHACGSCDVHGQTGALVEYYCGSGGSAPDHSVCELC